MNLLSRILRHRWCLPVLSGLVAFVAVTVAIDPAGDYPDAVPGPGLTVDESFNVQQGVLLRLGLTEFVLGGMSLTELFDDHHEPGDHALAGRYNPDHPPLGRLWLGLTQSLVTAIAPPRNHPGPFVTAAARVGSAMAFALTVLLVSAVAQRCYGPLAGLIAGLALILMPRVFGHAHLASLETFIGFTWSAAVLAIASLWNRTGIVTPRLAAITGLLLTAALLTKIQAVLLPIPVAIWALIRWRKQGIVPVMIWGLAGTSAFFLLWPWLWLDPVDHVLEYLGRTTDRATLYAWYFGERYVDRNVPWHYPFVMFLLTVPLGLHGLGLLGVCGRARLPEPESPAEGDRVRTEPMGKRPAGRTRREQRQARRAELSPGRAEHDDSPAPVPTDAPQVAGWRDPRLQLILLCGLFPLLVFAVPGVAVYDGARLFLVVFPLWAVVIGRGGLVGWEWLRRRWSVRLAVPLAAGLLAIQSWGLITTAPAWLSYYNLLAGGVGGADALGMEANYWGDSLTRDFLSSAMAIVEADRRQAGGGSSGVPAEEKRTVIAFTPVLHPFQLADLETQSPILRNAGVRLIAWDPGDPEAERADYLMLFFRRADLPPQLAEVLQNSEQRAVMERDGVPLAAFYSLPDDGNR